MWVTRLLGLPERLRAWLRARSPLRLRRRQEPGRYRVARAIDVPRRICSREVVIVGNPGFEWCALLLCPCGCGDTIMLSLLLETRPRWAVQIDSGFPTISPSIWRTVGCESHFHMTRGYVSVYGTDRPNT